MTLPKDRIGDKGQRYEVKQIDKDGQAKTLGWTDIKPERLVAAVLLMPDSVGVSLVDRKRYAERECKW